MGQERIAFSTQLMPIVVRIDTKCDDGVEQPVEIGVGRSSETGWICRGYGKPGEKRCCDARDLRETVTGNARYWRAIVSGVLTTLRLRRAARVGEMVHQGPTETVIIKNAWKVPRTGKTGATI